MTQPLVHPLYSDNPPKGVAIDEWMQVRAVLGRVVSLIGDAGPYFMVEWGNLEDREPVCRVVMELLHSGKSPRAVEDLLTEGGYSGCTHPVIEFLDRARCHLDKFVPIEQCSVASQTAVTVIDEAQNKLRIAFLVC
jgi:hypothetical protein